MQGLNEEQKCSWQYDLILTSIYPLLIAELLWGVSYLSAIQQKNPEKKLIGDLDWTKFTFIGPFISFIIGFLSGMLGIGGGELMGPMLLQWKVLPSVSVATTSFMSFLNTTSSVLHYLVFIIVLKITLIISNTIIILIIIIIALIIIIILLGTRSNSILLWSNCIWYWLRCWFNGSAQCNIPR